MPSRKLLYDRSRLLAAQELLTCNKLSELACLTLYMMYEKLRGRESRWCVALRGAC